MSKALFRIFTPAARFCGVRPVHVYALRVVYALMFFVLGKQTWTHVLTHKGVWEPTDAVAWCLWTAFATLAGLGLLRPLELIPILLLEVFYKLLWLGLVAYPLWSNGTLDSSPAASTASAFAWVLLPIVVMPWGYAVRQYIQPASRHRFGERPCPVKR